MKGKLNELTFWQRPNATTKCSLPFHTAVRNHLRPYGSQGSHAFKRVLRAFLPRFRSTKLDHTPSTEPAIPF